jgi:hypothetical protein
LIKNWHDEHLHTQPLQVGRKGWYAPPRCRRIHLIGCNPYPL